jgi:predicted dehydrogenase
MSVARPEPSKTLTTRSPLRVAIAGIGGFGAFHHEVFEELEIRRQARVIAACDPALDQLGEIAEKFHFGARGVQTYKDFDAMISHHSGHIDLGVVTAPIHLHAEMHGAFVRHKTACYLEKPPTLDPAELEQMIARENGSSIPTHVGFAYIHQPDRLALKRRMMTGEFGSLRRVSFLGLSPRTRRYFSRNNWAGKLLLNDRLVLDSCLGNAMAHFLNNLLFFAELQSLHQWARPANMSCELYRANAIEGADTIFAISRLRNGVEMRLAATHACEKAGEILEESLDFERARITIHAATQVTIQYENGATEAFPIAGASLGASVRHYCDFLAGRHPRPAQTLVDCRGLVETNALLYLAAGRIHSVPESAREDALDGASVVLSGVREAAKELIDRAVFPSQSSPDWPGSHGDAKAEQLADLPSAVRKLASQS